VLASLNLVGQTSEANPKSGIFVRLQLKPQASLPDIWVISLCQKQLCTSYQTSAEANERSGIVPDIEAKDQIRMPVPATSSDLVHPKYNSFLCSFNYDFNDI